MGEKELVKDQHFLVLLMGRFLAVMASAGAPAAVAFAVLEAPGGSPTRLSIVMACESIPMLAFMLAGGVVADRHRRSRVIVVGLGLSAVSFTTIGIILVTERLPWWTAGIAAVAAGFGVSMMVGVRDAMMACGVILLVVTLLSLLSRDVRTVQVDPGEERREEPASVR
jgi:MFS family permease